MYRICSRQFEDKIEFQAQRKDPFLFWFHHWVPLNKIIPHKYGSFCIRIYWFDTKEDVENLIIIDKEIQEKAKEKVRKLKGLNKAKLKCIDQY